MTRASASSRPGSTPRRPGTTTPADVTSFFAGLELVGPGVTEAQTWRARMPHPVLRHRNGHVLAGVARRQA
jgi:hypothetical protein